MRRTRTRSRVGKSYFTFRLVRSQRVGDKVRQRTLLNLGSHFPIQQDHWRTLCHRIQRILDPRAELLPIECDPAVEAEAQRIVERLLRDAVPLADPAPDPIPAPPPDPAPQDSRQPDFQCVDVDSLKLARPRSVGVEHAALWAAEQLGLPDLLRELGLSGPPRQAALGLLVGRSAAPASELATWTWLRQRSALGELLGGDFETMGLSALYRANDRLLQHRKVLETKLFQRAMGLFGHQPTVTLVDLTNTYFEGEAKLQPKARRGRSKEKRSDCPLLTLGLVLDGSGFVRRSEVLAGNVAESGTLAGLLKALEAPPEAVVVMDKGIATEENIKWLQEQGWRYVVASRERRREFDADAAVTVETASGTGLRIYQRQDEQGETRLYCESERRKQKENAIVERAGERLEKELGKLHAGLAKPRNTKRLEKVWQRIGRLREKYPKASAHYQIQVEADEQGKQAVAVTWERKPAGNSIATHPGVDCLRTNVREWDAQRLWSTYVLLTDLEAVFRSLKSELGLRPIDHWKPLRSEAHLFVTVLAYQLVQVIRTRLKEAGEQASWTTLRGRLAGQQRVTAVFRREDGCTLHVRKSTQAEASQQAIYDALGVSASPGGVRKIIVAAADRSKNSRNVVPDAKFRSGN